MTGDGDDTLPRDVHELLLRRSATVAAAESLTGGLVGAALTSVPGSSETFRGAVVAYATELKARLLGVSEDLLAKAGAVDAEVAIAMATGVRERLGATFGVATTGVAGPDPQDGKPVGTVFIAIAGPGVDDTIVISPHLAGDRSGIRALTVTQSLELLRRRLLVQDSTQWE